MMTMKRRSLRSAALALGAALAVPALAAARTHPPEGFHTQLTQARGPERTRVVMGPAGRAWLGLQMMDLNEELREFYGAPKDVGLLVSVVEEDSPAGEAGFQVGDVVTAIGDQPAGSSRDVIRAVNRLEPGETVAVEVVRNGAPLSLNATLGEREQDIWFSRSFGPLDVMMYRRDNIPEAVTDTEAETGEAVAEALAEARARMSEIDISGLTEEAVREALEETRQRMSEIDFEGLTERLAEAEARLAELEKKLAERREE